MICEGDCKTCWINYYGYCNKEMDRYLGLDAMDAVELLVLKNHTFTSDEIQALQTLSTKDEEDEI